MNDDRLRDFFATLEQMAAGSVELRLPISTERDTLDAIAFGINMMAGELGLANHELSEARDAAIRANEEKSGFLANLSHEIRTPMTAILGYIQLVRRFDFAGEKRQDYLGRAERGCRLLLRLVDDALDLAKVESGKLKIEKTSFLLRGFLEEILADLSAMASAKGLDTRFHVSDAVPDLIETDALRLKQILTNLIGNAIKFTATGEVRLHVGVHPGDSERLAIDIIDTGIGIDPEKASQLFTPFVQLDSTSARQLGGAGLGLALSRRLARLLDGEIELVDSRPGEGSSFRLSMPVRSTVESEVALAPPPSAGDDAYARGGALLGKRILVADDTPDNQMILRAILEHAGATVTAVDDGQALIDEARKSAEVGWAFDLVLIDIRMPGISGYDAARSLREMGYRGPLVAISAYVLEGLEERVKAAAFDRFINKPVEAERLIQALSEAIERRGERAGRDLGEEQ
jgi:signal transduction histidine kinase/AmiR/NasT family two-component response regulator